MSDPVPIRVMVVDDHESVRLTIPLALLTFDDIQPVGEAANGVEAVTLCAEIQPDVVIMDLMMPEMDGVTATTLIRQNYPQVKIIALTSFKDEAMVEAVLEAGANSYLLKNIPMDELAEAIRTVYAGAAGSDNLTGPQSKGNDSKDD